jgi:acetyl-CoA acetyltransferase family protein
MSTNREVFVVAAGRLPLMPCSRPPVPQMGFGFQRGAYHDLTPLAMAAHCVRGVTARLPGLDPAVVKGILWACANPVGPQNFSGRTIANVLGWEHTFGSMTNHLCSSSMRVQIDAANFLVSPFFASDSEPQAYVAGGVEKMSEVRLGNIFTRDYTADAYDTLGPQATAMGLTAEATARRFELSRQDLDDWSLLENQRARHAIQEGWFKDEIVPITIDGKTYDNDALPAELTPDALAKGKLYFDSKKGVVTQYGSSQMTDGAAALVYCNQAAVRAFDWRPLARFVGGAIGTAPAQYMGEGLIDAWEKYQARTGLDDAAFNARYGVQEHNTAFVPVPLALIKKHNVPREIVNIAGGATALGHPLGATGARLATTAIHLMIRLGRQFGLANMCVGEGQGGLGAFENLSLQ